MLTKGIIQSININENTCVVRIPLFETAGNNQSNEAEAIIAIPPGIFNGYKVGDVVIVGFESDKEGYPIVVGKLYLGASNEANNTGGAAYCNDLTVINSAYLPADIHINYTTDTTNKVQNSDAALTSYSTIKDIVSAIQTNKNSIDKLQTNTKNLSVYSTSEVYCGTWLDNSMLYKKTYVISDIAKNTDNSWSYTVSISNINYDIIHILKNNTFLLTDKTYENDSFKAYVDYSKNVIIIDGDANINTLKKLYITIEYTKK